MNRTSTQKLSSIIPLSFIGQFGRKIRIIQAGVLLLSAIPLWMATEAIAPQIVQAYTARVNLSLERLPDENYETLLRRAEVAARAAAQRSFDQDILVTEVSVIVSADNYGAIAPLLALEVSRIEWKKRPDPQRWATYFKASRDLLLFEQSPTVSPDPNSIPRQQTSQIDRRDD
ncbi:MAG TPA: hypothetical protein VK203_22545 [Nostocaceae cyanobacterium]|nr:hypothetical protein [Nostocaceae cyanobacterium]